MRRGYSLPPRLPLRNLLQFAPLPAPAQARFLPLVSLTLDPIGAVWSLPWAPGTSRAQPSNRDPAARPRGAQVTVGTTLKNHVV